MNKEVHSPAYAGFSNVFTSAFRHIIFYFNIT